jgi:hypothetical protein
VAFFHDNGIFGPTFYESESQPEGIDLPTWQKLNAIRAQESALGFRTLSPLQDSLGDQEEMIEAYNENSATGPVHMSVISAEGEVLALLNLFEFQDTPLLHRTLRECIEGEDTQSGTPVLPNRPPPGAQVSTATDLLLHLVSRFTFPTAELATHEAHIAAADNPVPYWEDAPNEVLRSRVAAPAQDWFTLTTVQWHTLVGTEEARPGDHWAIPAEIASLFHVHFGPPGETWMLESERIDAQSLEAEILSDRAGLRHIRLSGSVRMQQAWWHVDDDEFIEASTLGFLRYDTESDRILDFKMASVDAHYRGASVRPEMDLIYGVALVNLPNPLASATLLPADEAPALPGDQF